MFSVQTDMADMNDMNVSLLPLLWRMKAALTPNKTTALHLPQFYHRM